MSVKPVQLHPDLKRFAEPPGVSGRIPKVYGAQVVEKLSSRLKHQERLLLLNSAFLMQMNFSGKVTRVASLEEVVKVVVDDAKRLYRFQISGDRDWLVKDTDDPRSEPQTMKEFLKRLEAVRRPAAKADLPVTYETIDLDAIRPSLVNANPQSNSPLAKLHRYKQASSRPAMSSPAPASPPPAGENDGPAAEPTSPAEVRVKELEEENKALLRELEELRNQRKHEAACDGGDDDDDDNDDESSGVDLVHFMEEVSSRPPSPSVQLHRQPTRQQPHPQRREREKVKGTEILRWQQQQQQQQRGATTVDQDPAAKTTTVQVQPLMPHFAQPFPSRPSSAGTRGSRVQRGLQAARDAPRQQQQQQQQQQQMNLTWSHPPRPAGDPSFSAALRNWYAGEADLQPVSPPAPAGYTRLSYPSRNQRHLNIVVRT